MPDLRLLRDRFEACFKREMLSYEAMTIDSVMTSFKGLPEDTRTYVTECLTSADPGSYRDMDRSADVMVARMLHHGSPIRCIEDVAFLQANTDVEWDVLDDWHLDPDEADWTRGPEALTLMLTVLNQYVLTGFDYDPRLSLRTHPVHTAAQFVVLINVAWEIRATNNVKSSLFLTGWQQNRAVEPSKALVVDDAAVAQLVVDHPEYEDGIITFLSERGYDPELLMEFFGRGIKLPLIGGVL
jgi:hypothetical protein